MNDLKNDLTAALNHPRFWSDEQIEDAVRGILAVHPQEDDHLLTPEDREWMQKARVTMDRQDAESSRSCRREDEPTTIK